MVSSEFDVPDPPACPLLGLAVDPRTHYTFPHPDHRCYATNSLSTTQPGHQSAFCLSPTFTACVRLQAWQRVATSDRPSGDPQRSERGQPGPGVGQSG